MKQNAIANFIAEYNKHYRGESADCRPMIKSAIAMLSTINGVTSVHNTSSTMGSHYFDVVADLGNGDEACVCVRVSNHAATASGSNHGTKAFSFEQKDVDSGCIEGLAIIESELLREIDFIKN